MDRLVSNINYEFISIKLNKRTKKGNEFKMSV